MTCCRPPPSKSVAISSPTPGQFDYMIWNQCLFQSRARVHKVCQSSIADLGSGPPCSYNLINDYLNGKRILEQYCYSETLHEYRPFPPLIAAPALSASKLCAKPASSTNSFLQPARQPAQGTAGTLLNTGSCTEHQATGGAFLLRPLGVVYWSVCSARVFVWTPTLCECMLVCSCWVERGFASCLDSSVK